MLRLKVGIGPMNTEVRGSSLPMPPLEMRVLVGPTDESFFENPGGKQIFEGLVPAVCYESVLDIGSGCGRLARQLMLQNPRPHRYLGFDPHRGMVQWCQQHLTLAAPSFEFVHQDIDCPFNPGSDKPQILPFPAAAPATLMIATSVYTHLFADQTLFYLTETRRLLAPGGRAVTTWFLFDKRYFPFMQESQNELFINRFDPWNAVIYDRAWLLATIAACSLRLVRAVPPAVRGHQWMLVLARDDDDQPPVSLPDHDDAPFGLARAGSIASPEKVT
jgi:SAM-dependent methyltransferase